MKTLDTGADSPSPSNEARMCPAMPTDPASTPPGILRATIETDGKSMTIDYNPRALSDESVREVAAKLAPEAQRRFDKCVMRLGGRACEACALKLERKADVDYSGLLPSLFSLNVGSYYMQLASELDRQRVLRIVRENLHPPRRVFVGVIDPINPKVETPQEVRDRVLEASDFIPLIQLGTTDDCGFSPFGDDLSTARETAFAKIRARVEGTQLAAEQLG